MEDKTSHGKPTGICTTEQPAGGKYLVHNPYFQMVTMEDGICQGADEHMSTFKHAASGRQIHCTWCSLVVSLNDAVSVIVPFAPMIRVWLD